jgi:hypothetical protein
MISSWIVGKGEILGGFWKLTNGGAVVFGGSLEGTNRTFKVGSRTTGAAGRIKVYIE